MESSVGFFKQIKYIVKGIAKPRFFNRLSHQSKGCMIGYLIIMTILSTVVFWGINYLVNYVGGGYVDKVKSVSDEFPSFEYNNGKLVFDERYTYVSENGKISIMADSEKTTLSDDYINWVEIQTDWSNGKSVAILNTDTIGIIQPLGQISSVKYTDIQPIIGFPNSFNKGNISQVINNAILKLYMYCSVISLPFFLIKAVVTGFVFMGIGFAIVKIMKAQYSLKELYNISIYITGVTTILKRAINASGIGIGTVAIDIVFIVIVGVYLFFALTGSAEEVGPTSTIYFNKPSSKKFDTPDDDPFSKKNYGKDEYRSGAFQGGGSSGSSLRDEEKRETPSYVAATPSYSQATPSYDETPSYNETSAYESQSASYESQPTYEKTSYNEMQANYTETTSQSTYVESTPSYESQSAYVEPTVSYAEQPTYQEEQPAYASESSYAKTQPSYNTQTTYAETQPAYAENINVETETQAVTEKVSEPAPEEKSRPTIIKSNATFGVGYGTSSSGKKKKPKYDRPITAPDSYNGSYYGSDEDDDTEESTYFGKSLLENRGGMYGKTLTAFTPAENNSSVISQPDNPFAGINLGAQAATPTQETNPSLGGSLYSRTQSTTSDSSGVVFTTKTGAEPFAAQKMGFGSMDSFESLGSKKKDTSNVGYTKSGKKINRYSPDDFAAWEREAYAEEFNKPIGGFGRR